MNQRGDALMWQDSDWKLDISDTGADENGTEVCLNFNIVK